VQPKTIHPQGKLKDLLARTDEGATSSLQASIAKNMKTKGRK